MIFSNRTYCLCRKLCAPCQLEPCPSVCSQDSKVTLPDSYGKYGKETMKTPWEIFWDQRAPNTVQCAVCVSVSGSEQLQTTAALAVLAALSAASSRTDWWLAVVRHPDIAPRVGEQWSWNSPVNSNKLRCQPRCTISVFAAKRGGRRWRDGGVTMKLPLSSCDSDVSYLWEERVFQVASDPPGRRGKKKDRHTFTSHVAASWAWIGRKSLPCGWSISFLLHSWLYWVLR